MKIRSLALALVLAPAVSGTAAGQEPDTFRLGEIVVTATRTPQPRAAIPAHVTVLDGRALRARGLTRVVDALRAAGVGSIAGAGAPGATSSLFLRGGESDYVQVLVDGVQVNEPGGAFDWAHLSTADVERIEIVRGPASVLYGSDAVAGVVQIFTREGAGAPQVQADLGVSSGEQVGPAAAGSFATWSGSVAGRGAGRIAGAAAGWSVSAARERSDGLYAFNNEYQNTALSARLHLEPAPGTALRLGARLGDHRYHYPTDGAGAVVDHNRYTDGAARTLSLALSRQLTPALETHLVIGSYRNETGGNDPADVVEQGWSRSGARVRRDVAELRLDAALASAFTLSVGGELERQHGRTWFDSDGPFGPYADSSRNRRAARAAYAQLVGRAGPLALTGGARLDHSDQFGDFATGRAGATLALNRALALHAAWGTGFKEPTFFEAYATGFARGNPGLAPEESRSAELGVRFAAGALELRATAFDQRFRNLIQYTAAPPDPDAPSYFNVGRARARGAEAEATVTLAGVTIRASHTWLDTRVLDDGFGADRQFLEGDRLLRRPAHQAALGADWYAHPRVRASLNVRATGERDDLDFTDPLAWQGQRVTLPAHATADVDLEYALPLLRGGALRVGVRNLWDERYAEIHNFPQPGRVLAVGLRYGAALRDQP